MPFPPSDPRTPLLQFPPSPPTPTSSLSTNHHLQFCTLIGMPPLPHPSLPLIPLPKPTKDTLYQRALSRRRSQNRIYLFTASLSNTLLLSQVVLGAALTALGAAAANHILITVFGAVNTIIAGLVAYLKSRGQPMRARMYREDLERLVDEIESSATMWLGVATGTHGYDAIDIDERVTVRGEVARLTRLWDQAVRRNVSNDPDMYAAGSVGDGGEGGLRRKQGGVAPGPVQVPGIVPVAVGSSVREGPVPPAEAVGVVKEGQDAPAKEVEGVKKEEGAAKGKGENGSLTPAEGKKVEQAPVAPPTPAPTLAPVAQALDPDESPAAATGEQIAARKKAEAEASGIGASGQKANESMKRTPSNLSPGGA
ncbi:hypothetical protein BDZ85DRAFT_315315 [Elsinoe ampelina]|uniref:SMODS and SLOG-associating 2TM effector domain-containing protein n=1 Tax=Elsinoe ampelina TaxID=302913 RepID=A0A6A6GQD8_9PEZI|nr:hypothetical protein BDZ85DRAFT_315315 [Elsinoe ampelina]